MKHSNIYIFCKNGAFKALSKAWLVEDLEPSHIYSKDDYFIIVWNNVVWDENSYIEKNLSNLKEKKEEEFAYKLIEVREADVLFKHNDTGLELFDDFDIKIEVELPENIKEVKSNPRYEYELTSDAFNDPYAIWDNARDDYYIQTDGTVATYAKWSEAALMTEILNLGIKDVIPSRIPCIVYGKETEISAVLLKPKKNSMHEEVQVVVENKIYPLEKVADRSGRMFSEYESDDPWVFTNWKTCMVEKKETGRVTYLNDIDGDEYWYTSTDFRKHYTRNEG